MLWANNINPIRFERPGNQEFIANAPADIAYLLARVRETDAALTGVKQEYATFIDTLADNYSGNALKLATAALGRVHDIAAAALGQRVDGEA